MAIQSRSNLFVLHVELLIIVIGVKLCAARQVAAHFLFARACWVTMRNVDFACDTIVKTRDYVFTAYGMRWLPRLHLIGFDSFPTAVALVLDVRRRRSRRGADHP